jgi:hypothetical protein
MPSIIRNKATRKVAVIPFAVMLASIHFSTPSSAGGLVSVPAVPPIILGKKKSLGDPGQSSGDGCNDLPLRCDLWLQSQHKEVLLKLLKSYYVMSASGEANNPAQVELMAKLAARVVATN